MHRWSDATNDAIADGDLVIAFRCERCHEWVYTLDDDEPCPAD